MKTIQTFPTIRHSEMVCLNPDSTEVFVFPSRAMIEQQRGVLHHLAGVENSNKKGTGEAFNWILSNGERSTQREEEYPTNYTHMLPEGSHKMIRSVRIHYTWCIYGFSFLDKEGALLWVIGNTHSWFEVKTVLIADNEVIVGVVAKLTSVYQSVYTHFQFQIASR